MTSSFIFDNFLIDIALLNDSTLSVQLFNITTNKSFKNVFDSSLPASKQILFKEITEQRVSISTSSSPSCASLTLGGGMLVLSLPECEETNNTQIFLSLLQNKVKALEQQVGSTKFLEAQLKQQAEKIEQQEGKIQQQEGKVQQQEGKIQQQEEKIQQQEGKIQQQEEKVQRLEAQLTHQAEKIQQHLTPPTIHLSTSGTLNNLSIVWNLTKHIDNDHFALSTNQQQVTIKQRGHYRFDVKLLADAGATLYAYLTVNDKPICNFYGSGKGYPCRKCLIYHKINNVDIRMRISM